MGFYLPDTLAADTQLPSDFGESKSDRSEFEHLPLPFRKAVVAQTGS